MRNDRISPNLEAVDLPESRTEPGSQDGKRENNSSTHINVICDTEGGKQLQQRQKGREHAPEGVESRLYKCPAGLCRIEKRFLCFQLSIKSCTGIRHKIAEYDGEDVLRVLEETGDT